MTATYWKIGRRIVELEQGRHDRASFEDAFIKRLTGISLLDLKIGKFGLTDVGQMHMCLNYAKAAKVNLVGVYQAAQMA